MVTFFHVTMLQGTENKDLNGQTRKKLKAHIYNYDMKKNVIVKTSHK